MVVRRGDLDAVHADEIQVHQFFDERQHLVRAEPAGLGRSGAGGERRVQAIDIQAQVGGRIDALREPRAKPNSR